jgi:hypothetical protein
MIHLIQMMKFKKICDICGKEIIEKQRTNDIFGELTHYDCDIKLFGSIDKKVKYGDKSGEYGGKNW